MSWHKFKHVFIIIWIACIIIISALSCSDSTEKGTSMITDNLANAQKYYDMHQTIEHALEHPA